MVVLNLSDRQGELLRFIVEQAIREEEEAVEPDNSDLEEYFGIVHLLDNGGSDL